MKRRRKIRRLGTLLHEVVIVISLSSSLVLLGIRLLHQTMTFGSDTRSRIAFRHTSSQLADQFREDVHDAVSISLENEGSIHMQLGSSATVFYRSDPSNRPTLERRLVRPAGDEAVERFRLLDRSHVVFSRVDAIDAIAFEIMSKAPGNEDITRHELRVVAKTGRTRWIGSQARSHRQELREGE
ncbi:MAG: hypothetical protein ABL921_11090 [Pirellula sp.]